MNDDIQEQLMDETSRHTLRKRIVEVDLSCKQLLRRKSTPRQYQNLMMQIQALSAAITILNTFEVQ